MSNKIKKIILISIISINILIIITGFVFVYLKDQEDKAEIERVTAINTITIDETKFKNSPLGYDNTNVIKEIKENKKYTAESDYYFDEYRTSKHFELYYNSNYSSNYSIADAVLEIYEKQYSKLSSLFNLNEKDIPIMKLYMFSSEYNLDANLDYKLGKDRNPLQKYITVNSMYIDNITYGIDGYCDYFINAFANSTLPKWLHQGSVKYLADTYNDIFYREYPNFIKNNIDMNIINKNYIAADKVGYSMVLSIIEKFGEKKLIELLNSLDDYKDILNINDDELISLWKEYLSNNLIEIAYPLDEKDYVEIINKDGMYINEAGFRNNEYIETEHFIIYYYNLHNFTKTAKEAAEILESKYNRAIDAFGIAEENMPKIKINMCLDIYELYSSAGNIAFPIDHKLGYNIAPNSFNFAAMDISKYSKWRDVIGQLLVHSVYMQKINTMYPEYYSNESWLVEGLSLYYSNETDPYVDYYKDIVNTNLPYNPDKTKIEFLNYNDNYIYGYSIVECIIDNYGEDKIEKIIQNPDNFESILDVSLNEFSDIWKNNIKNKLNNK